MRTGTAQLRLQNGRAARPIILNSANVGSEPVHEQAMLLPLHDSSCQEQSIYLGLSASCKVSHILYSTSLEVSTAFQAAQGPHL